MGFGRHCTECCDADAYREEAVDRYLRVQYGTNLSEANRVAGDEAVIIGDVLLLATSET